MESILITSDNINDLDRIVKFAKQLKAKTRKINVIDIEDAELLKNMEANRKKDYVSEKEVISVISKQRKVLANES